MSTSLQQASRKLSRLFHPIFKHHAILFTLFVLVSLIIAVFMTNAILSQPTDEEYRTAAEAQAVPASFDQATIDKIDNLRERGDSQTPSLPPGRINPFAQP